MVLGEPSPLSKKSFFVKKNDFWDKHRNMLPELSSVQIHKNNFDLRWFLGGLWMIFEAIWTNIYA